MSHIGLGVLIGMVFGDSKSPKAYEACIGKKITKLFLQDNALHFRFDDATGLAIWDDGQSCCEHRYMVTDDNLKEFVGAKLKQIVIRTASNLPAQYDEHEVQFLDVKTTKGTFQMATHNEHNGYYGGFLIRCSLEK